VMQFPPELVGAFAEAHQRVFPESSFARTYNDSMAMYSILFAKATDGITTAGGFAEPEQWRFDWKKSYSTDEWLEQVPTFGGHNRTPPDELDQLLTGIAAAVEAFGGSFTMDYAAVVVTARRRNTPL
jgi:hypothetical protein